MSTSASWANRKHACKGSWLEVLPESSRSTQVTALFSVLVVLVVPAGGSTKTNLSALYANEVSSLDKTQEDCFLMKKHYVLQKKK